MIPAQVWKEMVLPGVGAPQPKAGTFGVRPQIRNNFGVPLLTTPSLLGEDRGSIGRG